LGLSQNNDADMQTERYDRVRDLEKKPPRVILPPSPNLLTSLLRVARKYGDVVYVLSPVFNFYLLNNPDQIHEVLVSKHASFSKGSVLLRGKRVFGEGLLTSEGEFHHRQKRIVQPAFYSSKVLTYSDIIVSCTNQAITSWKDKQILDVHREMTRLTMKIIAECLFSGDIGCNNPKIAQLLSDVVEYFNRLSGPFSWFFEKIPINGRYESSLRKIDKMIYAIIRQRRRKDRNYEDILSMLLRADDTKDHSAISDKQIRDEVLILFAAGHETTANALSWTWYLLAQNPGAEKRLHSEIDLVLGNNLGVRKLSAEDIPRLDYIRKVFTEALRLYPPAWVITRQAIRNVVIGGYEIPRGTNVVMSQYILQHDSRYFPHPERFDPDRWTDEMKSTLPRMAYFPFGGGPRSCVGESLAWMEGILIVAGIASKWKLELLKGEKIGTSPRTTLRPKKGIWMKAIRRESHS
jgi:cytochrome P450